MTAPVQTRGRGGSGVKDHGLLFKDEMCRAMGRAVDPKTQTRRLVARHNTLVDGKRWIRSSWRLLDLDSATVREDGSLVVPQKERPHVRHEVRSIYELGDHIWAKQVWRIGDGMNPEDDPARATFREDWPDVGPAVKWRSSLLMPKKLARYRLEITEAVRAERAHSINEEDARAEGVDELDGQLDEKLLYQWAKTLGLPATEHRVWFAAAWDWINGAESFGDWVWRIPFKRLESATRTPTAAALRDGRWG